MDEGEAAGDEEMPEAEGIEAIDDAANEPTGLEDIEPDLPERTIFVEYAQHLNTISRLLPT